MKNNMRFTSIVLTVIIFIALFRSGYSATDCAELLEKHGDFKETTKGADIKLQIDFGAENLSILKDKYELDKIAGTGDDLSQALNLLFWLHKYTYHNGIYDGRILWNSLDLLEYSFNQGSKHAINCRALSIILTECLLSIGLPARTVYIIPYSPQDLDNHVVTHVFIATLDKWIMLDPTWCSYFKDVDGNILDLFEIRTLLADGKEVLLNPEFGYNGSLYITNKRQVTRYKNYIAKDLFYFTTHENSTFGAANSGRTLIICPTDFNLFEWQIQNAEYRLKCQMPMQYLIPALRDKTYQESLARIENARTAALEKENPEDIFLFLSREDFLAKPQLGK